MTVIGENEGKLYCDCSQRLLSMLEDSREDIGRF